MKTKEEIKKLMHDTNPAREKAQQSMVLDDLKHIESMINRAAIAGELSVDIPYSELRTKNKNHLVFEIKAHGFHATEMNDIPFSTSFKTANIIRISWI